MIYFADSIDSGVVIGALFAGLVPMFAGFYAFAKYVLNNSRGERKEERDAFLSSIKDVNTTLNKLSDNIEMKQAYDVKHNGTSDELVAKSIEAITQLNETMNTNSQLYDSRQEHILNEIRTIKIKNQEVDTQHIKKQVVDKETK